MSESNSEIPKECPHIETCRLYVDKDHFEFICDTDSWVTCGLITSEELMKYKKIPSDWKKGVP